MIMMFHKVGSRKTFEIIESVQGVRRHTSPELMWFSKRVFEEYWLIHVEKKNMVGCNVKVSKTKENDNIKFYSYIFQHTAFLDNGNLGSCNNKLLILAGH